MCGVAGALGRPELVARLTAGLAHRGPDHQAVVVRGAGAVGAARLRINGGPEADMPLASRSARVLVAVNGEFFNHGELGPDRAGAGDLAALPDLLEEEGVAALDRIRGPFALVALDTVRRELLVARDEVGVRPLFVCEGRGFVAAASEVGPLRDVAGPARPDEEAWNHLLAFQFWPAGRTPWEGVVSLRPGEWRRYRLRDGRLVSFGGTVRCRGGERTLRRTVRRAFALQAPTDRPAGATLSGGLDSSAVLGGVVDAGHAPGVAAVGWFPGAPPALDERRWARAVARELGVRLIEVAITPELYREGWRHMIAALGGPLAGPGAGSQWVVARALAAEGVKVAFSGQGGDELFGGYERHRLLLQAELGRRPVPAPGYEPLLAAFDGDPVRGLLFRGAPLLEHLEPARARGVVEAAAGALPGPGPARVDRVLGFELDVLLPGLLSVEDRSLAAFGIEGRVPLLDPLLARRLRAVPLAGKSPPERPRALFRSLFAHCLPAAVRERHDKMGFPLPLDAWLRGPLRELLHDHPGLDLLGEVGFRPGVVAALRGKALTARERLFLLSCAEALLQARGVRAEAAC